jgi:hypothetical protein
MKRGNWTDEPCYYVSVIDGTRHALLVGPFRAHQDALELVTVARQEAEKVDARAVWYAFGTCKTPHGHRSGILNQQVSKRLGRDI